MLLRRDEMWLPRCKSDMVAGATQMMECWMKLSEHEKKMKALATSAMNGLKPDREEVQLQFIHLGGRFFMGSLVYVSTAPGAD